MVNSGLQAADYYKQSLHQFNVLGENTSGDGVVLTELSRLRAFGLTGAVKQGAFGARYSHIPCHIFNPFSRRKFWKSDSFSMCAMGANRKTNSCDKKGESGIIYHTDQSEDGRGYRTDMVGIEKR